MITMRRPQALLVLTLACAGLQLPAGTAAFVPRRVSINAPAAAAAAAAAASAPDGPSSTTTTTSVTTKLCPARLESRPRHSRSSPPLFYIDRRDQQDVVGAGGARNDTAVPPSPPPRAASRTSSSSSSSSDPTSHRHRHRTGTTTATAGSVGSAGVDHLWSVLDSVPSRGYVHRLHPTPIEPMPRLSALLCVTENGRREGPDLYVKRDDLLPLAGGGSKTRKLDYLVQQAIDSGADVLVTSGAVQSNHCRLTASAAAREGLECYLVLEERVPGTYDPMAGGNNYVFNLLGARQVPAPLGGVGPVQDELVERLTAQGKTVYVIPGGGSNPLGAMGYARCAAEIIQQSHELMAIAGGEDRTNGDGNSRLYWDAIVTCSGSGGTHTGLLTGLRAAGYQTPVLGVSVRFDSETQRDRIYDQCQACVGRYFGGSGGGEEFPYFAEHGGMTKDDVIVYDEFVGPGYSLPTPEMADAVKAFAVHESILLDPVYTGKGAAGLLSLVRSGKFGPRERVLFVHTGGAPSLYHYRTLPGAAA